MEASALHHTRGPLLAGISPHLRLQRDEKLIQLTRRGHSGAFEALVKRYESRLLAFCRSMLGSTEDAEDVLQEVFASAHRAICADHRHINARPWLYRIARNRCLNHLRSPRHAGQDSMDIFERDNGATTAETVQSREELRLIVDDVQQLPESQRTALVLREMEALSYDQIAMTMDTTIPAVKSLLVRARVSLAEASESRSLTCDEVRLELGRAAEGLSKLSPPVRRHAKSCERCSAFRSELKRTTRALAAAYPVAPLVLLHNLFAGKAVGGGVAAGGTAGGGTAAGAGIMGGGGGLGAAGALASATLGPIATKAAVGVAAAALLTAGAVEVQRAPSNPESGGAATSRSESDPSSARDHAANATVAPADQPAKEQAGIANDAGRDRDPQGSAAAAGGDDRSRDEDRSEEIDKTTTEATDETGPVDSGEGQDTIPTDTTGADSAGAAEVGSDEETTVEEEEHSVTDPDDIKATEPGDETTPEPAGGGPGRERSGESEGIVFPTGTEGRRRNGEHRRHRRERRREARAAREEVTETVAPAMDDSHDVTDALSGS